MTELKALKAQNRKDVKMNKKKRIVLIITIIFLLIAAVGAVVLALDSKEVKEDVFVSSFVYKTEFDPPSYAFYEPVYGTDIFEDPDYQTVVPYIYYTIGSTTRCITDGNYSSYGAVVEFFGDFFDALKKGDNEAFNSLHSERYFANNRKCEALAPQRLYNINIEYLFEKDMTDPDYGEVTKYVYKTSYMIMKNDGTFRSDIGSDASRALYLELVEDANGRIFVDACGDAYNLPE